jgi:hypothetical protein
MKKILVEVKGNREQAEKAAKTRKVPFVFVREYKKDVWSLRTVGEVDAKFKLALWDWFNEKDGLKPNVGFVPGVLISMNGARL